jgi:hypothetical protein
MVARPARSAAEECLPDGVRGGLYPPPSAVVDDVEPSERSRAFSTGYCFVP